MADFDFDDDDNYGQNDSQLLKDLRKQVRELAARNKELEQTNATLTATTRKATLSDLLKSKNANPKLAAFMTDVEPTDEAVTKWLADYSDVFNVSGTAGDAGKEAAVAAQTQDALPAGSPVPAGDDAAVVAFQRAMEASQRAHVGSVPASAPAAQAEAALLSTAGDAKTADQFFNALRNGQL